MADQNPTPAPVPATLGADMSDRAAIRTVSEGHLRPYGGVGGYGAPESDEDLGSALRDFLAVVAAQRWLILSTVLVVLSLTALVTMLQTPRYTATVRLQVEREAGVIVEGAEVAPTEQSGGQEFLRTQLELLRSRQLAERVVVTLQLQNTIKSAEGGSERDRADTARHTAATALLEALTIKPVPGSRLIDISYQDSSPQRAQRVANGYAEVFVASNLDKRFDANSYAKTFLEDQVKQLGLRVEESERAVVEYAEREQMLDSSDKLTLADQNLGIANNALGAANIERLKSEQLWRQIVDTNGMNLPQILSNASIDQLRQRRNALASEYEEKLETFKPDYPGMVQIRNKITEVDRQLATEVKSIRESLKAGFDNALKQENEMRKRVDDLRSEALTLQRKGIQYNTLKRDAETNRNLYNSLLQKLKQVDVAAGVSTNNVLVVDRATLPRDPSSPKILRALALALILSIVAGVALAYAVEMLDDRIKTPEDIEKATGLPVLGTIPIVVGNPIAELDDPRSALAESYRSLATALQFASKDGLPRSLVLTSSGPAEGKSSTAIALSRHFAQMGLKVLLVDSDMRRPSLHTKLGLDNSVGLSNFLTGALKPPQVIQATNTPNLAFMSAGPIPPNAADLLGGNRMFSLVSVGLQIFDLIIVDAPPMLGLADAQLLASATHATIFVAASGQVRRRFVKSAMQRILLTRTNLAGVVLTKFDASAVGYGYGDGGYGTNYYGQDYYGAPAEPALPAAVGAR
jgi:polysaccharide biosynthesis transport protein